MIRHGNYVLPLKLGIYHRVKHKETLLLVLILIIYDRKDKSEQMKGRW